MIEELAASYWRLHRAIAIEHNLFTEGKSRHPEADGMTLLGRAWDELADSPKLHTILRYQAKLHRTHRRHRRAMKNLLLIRDIAPENPGLPNEPSPISGHRNPPATNPPGPGPSPSWWGGHSWPRTRFPAGSSRLQSRPPRPSIVRNIPTLLASLSNRIAAYSTIKSLKLCFPEPLDAHAPGVIGYQNE